MADVFLGYPEQPPPHAIRGFAQKLIDDGLDARTWESLNVDGRIILDEILSAIETASMSVFDVTKPNPNVLFELGYAIGRARPVWLTLDTTDKRAQTAWSELAILKPLGYTAYKNSTNLHDRFKLVAPIETLAAPYDKLIEPTLPVSPRARDSVLYCKTFEPFEASSVLDSLFDRRSRRGLRVTVSDPTESSLNPLTWYAPNIATAAGVLVHFASETRNRSTVHNNRHALVAGLALGLDIPILMLAEEGYRAPFDYETRLHVYTSPQECEAFAREWLDGLALEGVAWGAPRSYDSNPLSRLRFGEHVAENERVELLDYFVETSAFRDVVAARNTLFVGHRGSGKTANAIEGYRRLAANKTCTAVLIKPASFEFSAMMAVVDRLHSYQHDYFFDTLWRFVIQSELAATLLQQLEAHSQFVPYTEEEAAFLRYAEATPFDLRAEVSVRLEQALTALLERLDPATSDVAAERNLINEAFHDHAIAEMRARLGVLLKGRKRVAIFVDNLDKGWERGADFPLMARFILGLLTAQGRVVTDFERQDYWRDAIKLSVAVFLRSDIYAYLRREAREPDKLPVSTIDWHDSDTLVRVIEERFLASELAPPSIDRLWSDYFVTQIQATPAREFIARATLPRPRDLVYFCNAAVGWAIDRGHQRVEESDFASAIETYSQYAYEALLVENGVTIPEMEEALLAFLGAPSIAPASDRRRALVDAGLTGADVERLLEKLFSTSFFGVEVAAGQFAFPEVGTPATKSAALAARLQPDEALRRTQIHRAYWAFLQIVPDST